MLAILPAANKASFSRLVRSATLPPFSTVLAKLDKALLKPPLKLVYGETVRTLPTAPNAILSSRTKGLSRFFRSTLAAAISVSRSVVI